jgi:hypothetical protein
MENIYIADGSEQKGPFTDADIRSQLASGQINGETLVWWDGLPGWTAVSQTPLGATPTPVAMPAARAPMAMPAPYPVSGPTKTSGLAIASLVMGLIGLLFSLLGIGAIITGHIARGQIRKDPSLTGSGLALAGLILGYFEILVIVAFIFLIAVGSQVKNVFSTISSQLSNAEMTNTAPATPGQ